MTTADAPLPQNENAPDCPVCESLPSIHTILDAAGVRERLDGAARRGRLPGLVLDRPRSLFVVRDFGHPFESELVATLAANPGGGAKRICFEVRVRPLLPAVFAIVLVLSIWPGIYVVDSMLKHYFSWYDIPTWWWYLPLTVPTTPWAIWSALRRSRDSALAASRGIIERIRAEISSEQRANPLRVVHAGGN